MIDLNYTVIIQLAVVLFLMVVLSTIVFKPFLGILEGRKNWIEAADRKARELHQRTEELMEKYRDAFSAAQAQGASIREEIRKQSLAQEMEILQKTMEEANRSIGEFKMRIEEETQAARASLRLQAQNLSREVAGKILGRSLR